MSGVFCLYSGEAVTSNTFILILINCYKDKYGYIWLFDVLQIYFCSTVKSDVMISGALFFSVCFVFLPSIDTCPFTAHQDEIERHVSLTCVFKFHI